MAVLYTVLGAFLRRWYGGLFPDDKYKILGNRGVQTAFMLAAFISIYLTIFTSWENWLLAVAVSCWLQFQFWSRGHGCCFDLGKDKNPSAETIERYNERWYHIPCDYLVKKGFFTYYGVKYDLMYMTLRYTCPMLPMMFFDCRYFFVGFSVSFIYLLFWELSQKINFEKLPEAINAPTKLAEVFCGGEVYLGCYLLGL